jgi:hypothetical protein
MNTHCLLLIDKVIRSKKEKIDYLKFFVRKEREREKKVYIWHINIHTSSQLIRSENNYRAEG